MQGARCDAVRALQAVGNAAMRRPQTDKKSELLFYESLVWREREQRSDLLILEALNLSAGPVATVHLPHRVPFGFHGAWRAN